MIVQPAEGLAEIAMIANGPYLFDGGGTMAATNPFPVFLVRHGRTTLNAENRLRGRLDPNLDDVGRAEAAELADRLATAHPVRVVSSPLRRAAQTARAIADRAGLDVVLAQGLNDRDYGEWAGQPKDQVVARWGSIDAAPGVEAAAAVVLPGLRGS